MSVACVRSHARLLAGVAGCAVGVSSCDLSREVGSSIFTDHTPPSHAQRTCCPCCQAPVSAASIEAFSDPRAEDVAFDQHGNFLSGYDSRRVFFTYVRCWECDACYCPRYYSYDQLQILYERQAENMADVPFGSRERTQMGYLDILRRHSRMAGGLLEIGADIGLFAEACTDAGRFDDIWLAEPNRNVHDQLRSRFPQGRVTILDSMSSVLRIPPG